MSWGIIHILKLQRSNLKSMGGGECPKWLIPRVCCSLRSVLQFQFRKQMKMTMMMRRALGIASIVWDPLLYSNPSIQGISEYLVGWIDILASKPPQTPAWGRMKLRIEIWNEMKSSSCSLTMICFLRLLVQSGGVSCHTLTKFLRITRTPTHIPYVNPRLGYTKTIVYIPSIDCFHDKTGSAVCALREKRSLNFPSLDFKVCGQSIYHGSLVQHMIESNWGGANGSRCGSLLPIFSGQKMSRHLLCCSACWWYWCWTIASLDRCKEIFLVVYLQLFRHVDHDFWELLYCIDQRKQGS